MYNLYGFSLISSLRRQILGGANWKLMYVLFHCELADDQGVFYSFGTCKPLKSHALFNVQQKVDLSSLR